MISTRKEVYDAIDSERSYQEAKWPRPQHEHSLIEFAVFMEDYLAELKHLLTRNDTQEVIYQAQDIMRKVTALGVASMEINGTRDRAGW